MKYTDINAIYTAKVTEFLSNGYTINTSTMSGSQGEIAHIDLRKGSDVIRVILEEDHDHEVFNGKHIVLTVGRCTAERVIANEEPDMATTIWNQHLEIIEVRKFWKFEKRNSMYYIEGDDGKKAKELTLKRWKARDVSMVIALPDSFKASMLPAIKRHLGVSRFSVNQVSRIYKRWNQGRYSY